MTTDFNVTVDLDTQDHDAVIERLDTDGHYSPAVHLSDHGDRVAVTFTIPSPAGAALEHATTLAMSMVRTTGFVPVAVAALPTEEFDRRAGLVEVALMISVPQAAERLGVSEQRVRQLLGSGKLEGEKVGRDWLVSSASVSARLGT